ncbi:MAG TPA: hypothetical protein VIH43_05110 [Chthoniobacterales bacterium]
MRRGRDGPHGLGEEIAENVKNTRLLVKYSYFNYDKEISDGYKNHRVHSVYSGLQIRF